MKDTEGVNIIHIHAQPHTDCSFKLTIYLVCLVTVQHLPLRGVIMTQILKLNKKAHFLFQIVGVGFFLFVFKPL